MKESQFTSSSGTDALKFCFSGTVDCCASDSVMENRGEYQVARCGFVKCSVNAVKRAVDPLISLYIHSVYELCLASRFFFMSLLGRHAYIYLLHFAASVRIGFPFHVISGFFPCQYLSVCNTLNQICLSTVSVQCQLKLLSVCCDEADILW